MEVLFAAEDRDARLPGGEHLRVVLRDGGRDQDEPCTFDIGRGVAVGDGHP